MKEIKNHKEETAVHDKEKCLKDTIQLNSSEAGKGRERKGKGREGGGKDNTAFERSTSTHYTTE